MSEEAKAQEPDDSEPTREPQATPDGDRWGDPISEQRAGQLKALADQQRAWAATPDHQGRKSYFQGVRLTGADVFWLAAYALAGPDGNVATAQERLRTARDRFEYDVLSALHLEGADLGGAHLEGADLSWAHLEGANLFGAHLERANLGLAFFDTATALNRISLGDATGRAVMVADVRWGGVNLAVVDWTPFTDKKAVLGDEQAARDWKPEPFTETEEQRKRSRQERAQARAEHAAQQAQDHLQLFQAAVRASRQLATVLRDQGMNEEADHFAYRAQLVQRRVFQLQHKRIRAGFSRFLNLLAGYGYKPERSVYVYLAVIFGFALGYWLVGPSAGHTFQPDGALVFSVTSFHGRGFFPGGLDLENWITRLAALEAVIGLLIEISFIATFTQRFFGSK